MRIDEIVWGYSSNSWKKAEIVIGGQPFAIFSATRYHPHVPADELWLAYAGENRTYGKYIKDQEEVALLLAAATHQVLPTE